jgi:outer membrane protein
MAWVYVYVQHRAGRTSGIRDLDDQQLPRGPAGRRLHAGLAGAAAPAGAETLAEAVALAYQTNPTLRAQRARLRAVDENVVQAQTGYAPRVSASGNATYTENLNDLGRESRFQNRPNNSSGPGSSRWTSRSTAAGRNAAAVAGARAEVLSGREQLRTVETNVLLSVIQAYADIRRDSEALRIRRERAGPAAAGGGVPRSVRGGGNHPNRRRAV